MKHKFSLIIPFLVFGVTGCNATNPYTAPKNKIKYSYKNTSKLEKINGSSILYVAEQAFSNFKEVSSYEGVDYYLQSGDIAHKSAVSFANLFYYEDDLTDYVHETGELFEDNVLEIESDIKYYQESNLFYNYASTQKTTQFYKTSEEDPEVAKFYVNYSEKTKTEAGKTELEGSYVNDYYTTTTGYELEALADKIFDDVDTEPFGMLDSDYFGRFLGKDKKGNYYAIFDYQQFNGGSDIFGNYFDDFHLTTTHNEYEFTNKDGSLYLTSYLSVYTQEFVRDLDGKVLAEPILEYRDIHNYSFEYETKKSASKHGSTELSSNNLSYYTFTLYTYDDTFTPVDDIDDIGFFYDGGPTYWIDQIGTTELCYLVAKEDNEDNLTPVDIEIIPGSTPYVQLIGDTEYKLLDFTVEGNYSFGTRYDKAHNILYIRIYYLGVGGPY